MALREDDSRPIYLTPDATDVALGHALLEALDKSRFIWPPDEPEFFEWQRYIRRERDWHKEFMDRFSYKTKREAYRNMNWCRIQRSEGRISIEPHKRRDQPEHWKWLPQDQTVSIPDSRDTAAVGAALRLALDRCE